MELLAPIGIAGFVRMAAVVFFTFFLPGYLLLGLLEKGTFGAYGPKRKREGERLFDGILERSAASVFLSILICAMVYSILVFSVGLSIVTAFLAMAAVIGLEAYFLWTKK